MICSGLLSKDVLVAVGMVGWCQVYQVQGSLTNSMTSQIGVL
jgi:hypothetical protein